MFQSPNAMQKTMDFGSISDHEYNYQSYVDGVTEVANAYPTSMVPLSKEYPMLYQLSKPKIFELIASCHTWAEIGDLDESFL